MREVLRRVKNFFWGPTATYHKHHDPTLWQFAIGPAIFFIKWQDPKTTGDGGRFHLDRLGVDLIFGPWTRCFHYIDNDPHHREPGRGWPKGPDA